MWKCRPDSSPTDLGTASSVTAGGLTIGARAYGRGAGRWMVERIPGLPSGPGDAALLAVDSVLRDQILALDWRVRSVPAPGGDLAGLGSGLPAACVDLVAVDHVLSPLHHADKRAALGIIARWLRPGGMLVLREPTAADHRGTGLGALQRRLGRLLYGRLQAHQGPAAPEFYALALDHVGFESTEILQHQRGVMVMLAQRRGH